MRRYHEAGVFGAKFRGWYRGSYGASLATLGMTSQKGKSKKQIRFHPNEQRTLFGDPGLRE